MNAEAAAAMTVTQLDRDLYCLRCSGFLILRQFVSISIVERIRQTAERFQTEVDAYVAVKGVGDRSYNWPLRYTRCLYALSTDVQDIVMEPTVQDIVNGYLSRPVLRDCLMQTNMVEPRTAARGELGALSYHRDTLWPAGEIAPMYLHVFLLLDDFKSSNGATVVVPGTHLEREPGYYFKDTDIRERQAGIQYRVYERSYFGSAVTLEAPRGSLILLDPMCIHTQGNNVTHAQRALVNMTFRAGAVSGEPRLLNARAIAERHARVKMRSDFLALLESDNSLPAHFGPLGADPGVRA
jgi:hypothetical protein